MKKTFILITLLLFLFVSCSNINSNTPIIDQVYLKLEDKVKLENCKIKMSSKYDSSCSYSITPNGFDLDELAKKGYIMNIAIKYNVYFEKDYSFPIGYMGAPYFQISLMNSEYMGWEEKKLASSNPQQELFSKNISISELKNTKLILTFSTQNIQNIIYITNAVVEYKCIK